VGAESIDAYNQVLTLGCYSKRFVIEHEYNPLFDLLGQLLAMAIHDNVFVADVSDIEKIYRAKIPDHKRGMQLKIRRDKLDLPIFREPERSANGYRTSEDKPLKASTYSRNIKRLGVIGGLEENLTQKCLRRGTINAINSKAFAAFSQVALYSFSSLTCSTDKAPPSVRDQISDHESNAVKYYLNEVVDFDTAAAFHERISNEEVQKEARLATLMADMTAPTDLNDKDKDRVRNHPDIKRLAEKCRRLTAEIKKRGYRAIPDAEGTGIHDKKMAANKKLNRARTCLRDKLKMRARKRHFRNSDTMAFNGQFGDDPSSHKHMSLAPPVSRISERATLIQLIFESDTELTFEEEYARRIACIRLWIGWQDRQESPRRGLVASTSKRQLPPDLPDLEIIPETYGKTQCPLCIGDESKPWHERTKCFSTVNRLWDHVEKLHRQELAAFATGTKICPIWKARRITFVLSSIPHFKHHSLKIHHIKLRP
jgi:hypothetical protein